MRKIRKIVAAALGLAVVSGAGSASAGTITVDGITMGTGLGDGIGQFLTDPSTAAGFLSLGLGSYVDANGTVDVIRDSLNNVVWSDGGSPRKLSWALDGPGLQVVDSVAFSSTLLALYLGTGGITYLSDADGGGDQQTWLTADLASVGLSPNTGQSYSVMALIVHSGPTVLGISNGGSMFYDVTGGLAEWALDNNAFGGHDMDGTFSTTLPGGTVIGSSSTNFRVLVPEPATLGLLGAGLLGLGIARRRKRS